MSLSTFKQTLRLLGIIPHFTSDYKAAKVYRYLMNNKNLLKSSNQGINEQEFLKATYIVFSLSVDAGDASVA